MTQATLRKGRPAKKGTRGGVRDGAGPPPKKQIGLAAMPSGYVAQVVEGGVSTRGKGTRGGEVGALAGAADSNRSDMKAAQDSRNTAARKLQETEVKLREAHAEITQLKAAAAAASQSHVPQPTPTPASAPAPIPTPAPTLRQYKSESSKVRAVKKLRMFLMLYPEDVQADLVARAIVVDGRWHKSGLSVSIVKDLLSNHRMRSEMKQYATELLRAARAHMMKEVFSAAKFTIARRLCR